MDIGKIYCVEKFEGTEREGDPVKVVLIPRKLKIASFIKKKVKLDGLEGMVFTHIPSSNEEAISLLELSIRTDLDPELLYGVLKRLENKNLIMLWSEEQAIEPTGC
ncbi:MAG: hypothetical protein ACE5K4_00345 [Candidatus Hydrothermarchaeota archaeon]